MGQWNTVLNEYFDIKMDYWEEE
jgi:hypothetical protein